MQGQPHIYFIIPAFNEAENLPRLFASLDAWRRNRGIDIHIVVVDDGSSDETATIVREFKELPLTLVQHPVNLGVHRVFQTGFDSIAKLSPFTEDLIVTLEADNTSSLKILDRMLE